MNPPAYEHIALELAFSAATAGATGAAATVVNISKRNNDGAAPAPTAPLLYRIVQQRKSKLASPFKPDLEITHVPTDRVVGTVKIRSLSHTRQLLFPQTQQSIVYKDCFKSPHGNGSIHWYLAAPSYDGGDATVELRRGDKHRKVICRVVVKGGLGQKNGTIDVMNYRDQQPALDEIIVSTAAEIWDTHGKGQGEDNYSKASRQRAVYTTFITYDRVDRGERNGQVA